MTVLYTVACVFPMVVISILSHAEFGRNDHWEDVPHFNFTTFVGLRSNHSTQQILLFRMHKMWCVFHFIAKIKIDYELKVFISQNKKRKYRKWRLFFELGSWYGAWSRSQFSQIDRSLAKHIFVAKIRILKLIWFHSKKWIWLKIWDYDSNLPVFRGHILGLFTHFVRF